jgi:rare lipoprotein A
MMTRSIEGKVKLEHMKRRARLALCALIGLGMSACASTNVVKMSEPAPITYKIGKGDAQFASLTRPKAIDRTRQRRATPRLNAPLSQPIPYKPEYRAEPVAPQRSGPQFDPNTVDVQLYSHQKLGQQYSINGQSYQPEHDPTYDVAGIASWYGEKFHGRPTATGEIYNMNDMTAAHRTLPLNSLLHVENLENGRSLIVRLNDRGPFVDTRIIDLSKGAAEALGAINGGLARVRVRYIGPADPNSAGQAVTPPLSVEQQPRPQVPVPTPYSDPLPYEAPKPASPYESALPTLPYENPTPSPQTPQVSLDYFDMPQAEPQFPDLPQYEPNYPIAENSSPIAPHSPLPIPGVGQPMPDDDSQITLTIKGPIHIAKSDDNDAMKPEFIPAVNSRIYRRRDR